MNKALFLDRDGIINVDHGYVYQKENFEFVSGIFELCQKAIHLNYKIIVITNQAGIARGYYTEDDFFKLTTWMNDEFLKRNIDILDIFHCPHHPNKGINEFGIKCNCRKPAPGMILQAQIKYQLNLHNSILIGDKISDMIAAKKAGVTKRILVNSQYHQENSLGSMKSESITGINNNAQFRFDKVTLLTDAIGLL